MYRVFNMGLGMVFAVSPGDTEALRGLVPGALEVGHVVALNAGEPRVVRR
jgi:phosphoribosylaminoimidazole (AIR) synthetase